MKDKRAAIGAGTLLVLIIILAGSVFHPFASAGPPVPTPALKKTLLQFDVDAVKENLPTQEHDTSASEVAPIYTGNSSQRTFYSTADAEIRQGYPTTNYGTSSEMHCGYDDYYDPDGRIVRCLTKFDIASIPPGATINSATLHVYLVESWDFPYRTRTYTAYRIPSDWFENSVTWSNAPSPAEAYGSAGVTHEAWGWYSFTVTSLVQAWHNGTYPNYGIMLRGPEWSGFDSSWKAFATKGSSRYRYGPRLVVDLELPPPTLAVAPSSLNFINDAGGLPVRTQELVIQNTGDDIVSWSATESAGWLSLDKTSGTTRYTSPSTIRVSADRSGLSPGHYAAQIEIASTTPGVQGSPQVIDVTLDLAEQLPRVYLPVVLRDEGGPHARDVAALIVGISDYENMVPFVAPSSGRAGAPGIDVMHSYDDAIRFDHVMCEKGGLCSSSQVQAASQSSLGNDVKMLLDSWATKEAIRQAIVYWLDGRENENTTVIIFFSGHGMFAVDDDGDEGDSYDEFICPYDLECDPCYPEVETPVWIPETAIRDDELDAWLNELESNRIVIIVDSCFSGGMASGAAALGRGLLSRADLSAGVSDLQAGDGFARDIDKTGRVVLMASAEDQGSWEFSALEHGAFTYYLIEALSSASADTNHNGWVSAEEAFAYLVNWVDSYVYDNTHDVIGGPYHQNPQISDGVTEEIDLTQP